ncbi:hypothetical protein GCM10008904_28910 [Paraclostridium ghonii]|uniref:Uncharacterized protein n=1 Tax=Paraclostridium ghonii TaxID=29358 RepID=A0ABU0N3A4_9FIRM|nr:hypothetical protein [Paeniclostridium ghonii]MDQ0557621.1 hypothetical protein [Paeniclostridium ghonii]
MEDTLKMILDKLDTIESDLKQLKIDVKRDINNLEQETKQRIEQLDCNVTTTRRVLTEQVYKNTLEIEQLRK